MNANEIICAIIRTVWCVTMVLIVFNVIMTIKNEVTYRNHKIILDAICDYGSYCIKNHMGLDAFNCVTFDDMEGYQETLWRWWDWGYTRILPPEKFELIKPFIRGLVK